MVKRLALVVFLLAGLLLALSACEKKQATTPTITATATTVSGQLSTPTVTAPPAVTVDEVTLPSFGLSAELNINTEDLAVLGLGDLDVAALDTGAQDYGDITVDTTIDVSDLVDQAVSGQ